MRPACDYRLSRCHREVGWKVQVATRKADAQLSCGVHLNYICAAMVGAEDRAGVTLTLTPVG